MGWVFFQVILAFGVAVFIVWWTFPRKKKDPPVEPPSKDPPA
jgi:hypothetical protein